MATEQVYTVEEYYDGPVSGVADFAGQPHFYQRVFDDARDEYGPEFDLTPISQQLLALVLEQWTIWRRWEFRFARKEVSLDSHPGYGGRDFEYDRLQTVIQKLKAASAGPSVRVCGVFRPLAAAEAAPIGVLRDLEVEWMPSATK